MTETKSLQATDSEALQDTKLFLTLKNGLDTTEPTCFLCSQVLSESYIEIETNSHIRVVFHPGCDEVAVNVFDALFGKSLRYYLENGFKDLFKKEGMIKSIEL